MFSPWRKIRTQDTIEIAFTGDKQRRLTSNNITCYINNDWPWTDNRQELKYTDDDYKTETAVKT